MKEDDFGDRMKALEREYTDRRIPNDEVLCVRIDGKRFSKFTKACKKPFDKKFSDAMIKTTKRLVEETNATFGYTQSDEITLIFSLTGNQAEHIFGGKVSKVNSILASMASAFFNAEFTHPTKLAYFDCRAWGVPDIGEASNVVLWRVQDCRKNSVSAAYRWIANKKKTPNQTIMKQYLLDSCFYSWDEEESKWKYGTGVIRQPYEKAEGVIRTKIVEIDMSYFIEEISFEARMRVVGQH